MSELRAKEYKGAGGRMPENMPTPKRSISQIEREQLAKLKEMAKKASLCWMNNEIRSSPDFVSACGSFAKTDVVAITKHYEPLPEENPWVHGRPPVENIEVVQHDPNWPDIFKELELGIKSALGNIALSVEHVGSTAVPGLAAKPVIDIDLTVADPTEETSYVPQLEGLGYDLYIREPSWHEHRCFRLATPRANLHVFGPDCPEVIRHVMFREWLKSHQDDLKLYERSKLEALNGVNDVTEYNLRKQPVIRKIYGRMFKAAGLL